MIMGYIRVIDGPYQGTMGSTLESGSYIQLFVALDHPSVHGFEGQGRAA